MRLKGFKYIFYANLMLSFLPGSIKAQEFQRSYSLGTGKEIRVGNVSGDVKITGSDGESIYVAGYKDGPDRDMVQIEDASNADRVDLKVKYPETRRCNASVHFEIRVPRGISYDFNRISSVSGNVEITEVAGKIKAESVSGNVYVRNVNGGIVSASSVSGNVVGEIAQMQDAAGIGEMKFSSISGNVDVKAPASIDAAINLSSISGSVKTDFPIEMHEKRYGPGQSASGQVGNGSHSLRLSTISGHVHLSRR